MPSIDSRLEKLEQSLQPKGGLYVAWPTDNPDLFELGKDGEILTLEAITARLSPQDYLFIVVYDDKPIK